MADPSRLQRARPLAPHRRTEHAGGRTPHRPGWGGPQLHDPKWRAGARGPALALGPGAATPLRHRRQRPPPHGLRRGVPPETRDGRRRDVLAVELSIPDPAGGGRRACRTRREGGLRGGVRRGAARARAPRRPGLPGAPSGRAVAGAVRSQIPRVRRDEHRRGTLVERRRILSLRRICDRLANGRARGPKRGGSRRRRSDGDRPARRAGGILRRPRRRPAAWPGGGPDPAHRDRGQLHRRLLPHRVLRSRRARGDAGSRGGGDGDRRRLGGPTPRARPARRLRLPAPRRIRHGADDGGGPRRPPPRPRRRRDGRGGAPEGHVRGVPAPPRAPARSGPDGARLRPRGRGRPAPLPVGGAPRRPRHRGRRAARRRPAPPGTRARTT